MAHASEHRAGSDRRRRARGGRRPGDTDGLAPLVMLVGDDVVNLAEAVLATLRFAVATTGADDALRTLPALRPDIVVAERAVADRIRRDAPAAAASVVMTDEMRKDPYVLIDSIRETLRAGHPG